MTAALDIIIFRRNDKWCSDLLLFKHCFNPFSTNVPLLYPLKTENLREYRSGTSVENGLKKTKFRGWCSVRKLDFLFSKLAIETLNWRRILLSYWNQSIYYHRNESIHWFLYKTNNNKFGSLIISFEKKKMFLFNG